MKRIACLLILLACSINLAGPTLAQSLTKEQAGRNVRRSDTVLKNGHLRLWEAAIGSVIQTFSPNDADHTTSVVSSFFVLGFASKLWKGDAFEENLSKSFLARIPNVSKPAFDEWRKALLDSTGTDLPKLRDLAYSLSRPRTESALETKRNGYLVIVHPPEHEGEGALAMYMLYQIIQQDRLFDRNNEFKNEESKLLLSRLTTVPRDSIIQWSNVIDLDGIGGLHEAATSIIEQDSFFVNDSFQQNAFNIKLKELKAAKKK